VELRAPRPRGISRPAGTGRIARSGPGIRQGDWHFWGVPDGLLSFDIPRVELNNFLEACSRLRVITVLHRKTRKFPKRSEVVRVKG